MDAPWRIQLLGALRAQMGETTITRFATSRVAVLLARLALYPRRAHSREELCDLLWPEADLPSGRLNLRVAIASLRRQLEPPPLPPGSVLVADRSFVGLNADAFRCDVADFEAAWAAAARTAPPTARRDALARAAALYGGNLLPGSYDDWVVEERERLAAVYDEIRAQQKELAAWTPSGLPPEFDAAVDLERVTPAPRLLRLPLQFTRFFGREQDRARAVEVLEAPDTRLVTLSGPGGVGKTRLAVETARQISAHPGSRFAGPVCFVPLADLSDARLIPAAVAEALALPRDDAAEPLDQVVAALSALPPALLVLDNFEHLVERGAPLVLSLLTRLPALACLVTSRRRLALPGEREQPVRPLSIPPLPPPDAPETPDRVAESAGAQLFVDRAQAARPDFQLTRGNAAAVAALCRNLEGLPLAIELVAARASVLSPAQMNERLAHRFEVLTGRRGDKDGRHRSLWAAVAWSYDLIPAALQRFFAGLSVFRGGCTVEAAQAVCAEPAALEFLTQLRERSLVTVEHDGAEPRFRLLETLREFADEHLPEEERARLRTRHGDHFTAQAEASRAALRGPAQAHWLERLEADNDNLRAALDAAHADTDGAETELRLAAALVQFWAMRGYLREGCGRVRAALARGEDAPPALRAAALHGACFLAYWQGDYPATQTYSEAALSLWDTLDDRIGPLKSRQMLANALLYQGRHEEAKANFTLALTQAREIEGEGHHSTTSLGGLAIIAHWQGDYAQARALYAAAVRIHEADGDSRNLAFALYNLGEIEQGLNESAAARACFERSLALCREHGSGPLALVQISLALAALDREEWETARALFEESLAVSRETGEDGDTAVALRGLGRLALRQGQPASARLRLAESLGLHQKQADTHQIMVTLEECAALALAEGRAASAARLLGASQALGDALGVVPTPAGAAETERCAAQVRAVLGEAFYGALSEEGRHLPCDEAVTLAVDVK